MFWRPFYFWNFFCGWSIWTTTQNREILAWNLSELWSILCFGSHFVFGGHLVFGRFFLQRVNINFHSKFWSSSLKNVWAMINFVFLVAILFLGQFCLGSIWTSMLKFVLLAWKLNDVWSILCFGGHLVFGQKNSDIFVEGLTT